MFRVYNNIDIIFFLNGIFRIVKSIDIFIFFIELELRKIIGLNKDLYLVLMVLK